MTDHLDTTSNAAADRTAGQPPQSLVHRMADELLLATEDRAGFHRLYAEYEQVIQPRDAFELGLLSDVVAIRWRLQRLRAVEACLLEAALAELAPSPPADGTPANPMGSITAALEKLLLRPNSVQVKLSRLESRLQQQLGQALRQLKSWRSGARASAPSRGLQPMGAAARPAAPAAAARGGDTPALPVMAAPRTSARDVPTAGKVGAARGWRPRPSPSGSTAVHPGGLCHGRVDTAAAGAG